MKVLISHPHGNKNTKKVVSMLGKLNLLDSFWTTIAFPFFKNFAALKPITTLESPVYV